jgi:hypothetical protein
LDVGMLRKIIKMEEEKAKAEQAKAEQAKA